MDSDSFIPERLNGIGMKMRVAPIEIAVVDLAKALTSSFGVRNLISTLALRSAPLPLITASVNKALPLASSRRVACSLISMLAAWSEDCPHSRNTHPAKISAQRWCINLLRGGRAQLPDSVCYFDWSQSSHPTPYRRANIPTSTAQCNGTKGMSGSMQDCTGRQTSSCPQGLSLLQILVRGVISRAGEECLSRSPPTTKHSGWITRNPEVAPAGACAWSRPENDSWREQPSHEFCKCFSTGRWGLEGPPDTRHGRLSGKLGSRETLRGKGWNEVRHRSTMPYAACGLSGSGDLVNRPPQCKKVNVEVARRCAHRAR